MAIQGLPEWPHFFHHIDAPPVGANFACLQSLKITTRARLDLKAQTAAAPVSPVNGLPEIDELAKVLTDNLEAEMVIKASKSSR